MHTRHRNINTAFNSYIDRIELGDYDLLREESRNGPVLTFTEPVTITYENPLERVLFNPGRDCNPFFHLVESLWMLAGCNDVEMLKFFNSNIANYSDDGQTFNGAYGYRWRNHPRRSDDDAPVDQLALLIEHLRTNPTSRRAVLEMWTVEDDLLRIDTSKDVCCNTHVYFRIESGYLSMTVCNRSNDLIWGCFGANAVHFSFLQEYMASALEVKVGEYHQFTNNLHIYTDKYLPNLLQRDQTDNYALLPLATAKVQPVKANEFPLFRELHGGYESFDRRNVHFVLSVLSPSFPDLLSLLRSESPPIGFHANVAAPIVAAYHLYKQERLTDALEELEHCKASDWRFACQQWIKRRKAKRSK